MNPWDYLRQVPPKNRPRMLPVFKSFAEFRRELSFAKSWLLGAMAAGLSMGLCESWLFGALIALFSGTIGTAVSCSLRRGFVSSNWGTFFRETEPMRYWLDMGLMTGAYVFLVMFGLYGSGS